MSFVFLSGSGIWPAAGSECYECAFGFYVGGGGGGRREGNGAESFRVGGLGREREGMESMPRV